MAPTDFRPSSRSESDPGLLTDREVQVLALVAQGLTDKGIAHELGISRFIVAFHLRNIRRKLDAASRVEAVTRARQAGYDV